MTVPFPPLLQVTTRDVILFQQVPIYDANPALVFVEPVRQNPTTGQPTLISAYAELDRLNMIALLPDLGVVAVASQRGRAAVFSLTEDPTPDDEGLTTFGLRLDWILPFKSQEECGFRPAGKPLLGIAASPIPGSLGLDASPGRRRRWRLMLTYSDFTILSYEIRLPTEADEVSIQEMVI